jgi:tRNA (pseudouridine54-N1)-methyltransferase
VTWVPRMLRLLSRCQRPRCTRQSMLGRDSAEKVSIDQHKSLSARKPTAMRVFVLRARSAPTDSQALLDAVGKDAHTEILAHTLMNAIFVAQSHRTDVMVHLVLESTSDYSRTISFSSNDMRDIGGFHERTLLGKIAQALDISRGMGKEESRLVESGITVRTISFEKLVQELAEHYAMFVMDKKGTPIRGKAIARNPCFMLTDHMPMPKNSAKGLERLGAEKISLGSKMLFASQCVLLIHNELDYRETGSGVAESGVAVPSGFLIS